MPKLPEFNEENPIITEQRVSSKASAYDAMSKTLGTTSDLLFKQAGNMAKEASSSNLLQAHASLSDLISNSKIQMYQDPANAAKTYQSTVQTAKSIQDNAYVNKHDKSNYDYMQNIALNSLNQEAQITTIKLDRENAKFQGLYTYNDNLQTLHDLIFTDPKAAKIMHDTMLNDISGKAKIGIYTGVEAANLANGLSKEYERGSARISLLGNENADARHINAINSYQPNPKPYSNANLPMNMTTQMLATDHLDHLNTKEMQAQIVNGNFISAQNRYNIKSDEQFNTISLYQKGAMQAEGTLNSGTHWIDIKNQLKKAGDEKFMDDEQSGYYNRLHNVVDGIEKQGKFYQFVSNTPAGQRATLELNNSNAAIDQTVYPVPVDQQDQYRNQAKIKNLNDYWSKLNALGIGIDVPDQYRNFISPAQIDPIKNSFKGGDNSGQQINDSLNNISVFDKNNLPYAAKLMNDPRKELTVREIGNLYGKADKGFLSTFMLSQQDNNKSKVENVLLDQSKDGSDNDASNSDKKLFDMVKPSIQSKLDYFRKLPNSSVYLNAEADKAVRYIKTAAILAGDYNFKNVVKYVQDYADNTNRAYNFDTSFNHMIDGNVIPGTPNDYSLLTEHALNTVKNKLLKYKNQAEVDDYFSRNSPFLVSTPTGRLTVINSSGQAIADKDGHAAFDEIYNGNMLSAAKIESQKNAEKKLNEIKQFSPMSGI